MAETTQVLRDVVFVAEEEQYCKDCRFWSYVEGLCRRYPATVEKEAGEWCGEWRCKGPQVALREGSRF